MIDNTSAQDEVESVPAETESQNAEDQNEEIDPFFGTGFYSFHHQPDDVDDEAFVGE